MDASSEPAAPELRSNDLSVTLVALDPPEPGRRISVDRSFFVIGRSRDAHLQLNDHAVSAQHVALVNKGGELRLRDLGSTNGCALNGRFLHLEEALLHHGDLIEITPFRFTLSVEAASRDQEDPARRRITSPDQPIRLRLISLDDEELGRTIEVRVPRFVIGREIGCDLLLPDPAVSSRHAVLMIRDNQVLIRDLDSTNGTLLNGEILHDEEAELQDSDELEFTPFQFGVAIGEPEVIASSTQSQARGLAGVSGDDDAEAPRTTGRPSDTDIHVHPAAGTSFGSVAPFQDAADSESAPPGAAASRPVQPSRPVPPAPESPASILETLGEVVFRCPECDEPGRVALSMLDRVLQCPSCQARFRVDSGGRPTLEAPGKGRRFKGVTISASDAAPLWSGLVRLARFAGGAVLVLAVLAGLYLGGSRLGRLTAGSLPDDLPGRGRVVAQAFLDEDPEAITSLALPGTQNDLDIWVQLARPRGWRNRVKQRSLPKATVRDDMSTDDGTRVILSFDLKYASDNDASGFLPTVWKKAPDGTWHIDGTATRKATPAALRDPEQPRKRF